MTPDESAVVKAIDARFEQTLEELVALAKIPSVSWAAFDPAFVQQSAEAVATLAEATGLFESVRILRSERGDGAGLGHPAVVARREPRNGAPTVLLYAHHDVQPPGDDSLWSTPAFEPTIVGSRLYGRGTADDKAGIIAHIASLTALTETHGSPDIGIVLFVEGEEESGSPSFENFLQEHHQLLASDVIVVADSGNWTTEIPALTTSLRGNVTCTVSVRTLDHAVHSGMFGGAVPDGMLAMVQLLASCYNDRGEVAISGLETADLETPAFSDDQAREESGLLDHVSLIGHGDALQRIWARPALTITGLDVPPVAQASNTLLPSVSARLSLRVAPGQRAEDAAHALVRHLHAHAPFGVTPEVTNLSTGQGFQADAHADVAQIMREAMRDGWGSDPVDIGVGGSIPFISSFATMFPRAAVLVTGVEDPDSRAHSPNESLELNSFRRAIGAQALFLSRLCSLNVRDRNLE
jgi:acetylornithine deacetylase/succinyl-diaminopimelate desuccinylase-like protein